MVNIPLPLLLLLLKLSGRRRRFESITGLRSAVRNDSAGPPPKPPAEVYRHLRVEQRLMAGHPCYILSRREGGGSRTALLYVHGGAHVSRITAQHWHFVAALVAQTGCVAHVALYPLAPEAGHREALPVLEANYRELAESGRPFVLAGDSSGGGLALVLAQRMVARGLAAPAQTILISPWLDLSLSYARRAAQQIRDPWLDLPGLAEAARWWAQGEALSSPHLSPLNGDLSGLGPLAIFIAGRDLLCEEGRELRRRAQAQGLQWSCFEESRMIHVWPLLPLVKARSAREQIEQLIVALN